MSDDRTRRRFPRIPSANTVLVTRLGEETIEEFARTRTMGGGGCSFLSDERLGTDGVLEILISVEHEVLKSKARVAYENEVDGKWEIGVEFLDLSDDDRKRINDLLEADPTDE